MHHINIKYYISNECQKTNNSYTNPIFRSRRYLSLDLLKCIILKPISNISIGPNWKRNK